MYDRTVIGTAMATLALVLCPLAAQAQAQAAAQVQAPAHTDAAAPDSADSAYEAMKSAEDAELRDVRENGPKKRFVLPMFKASGDAPSRASISAPAYAPGAFVLEMVGKGDTIAMKMNGFNMSPVMDGNGSIHRFVGRVQMMAPGNVSVTFVGEGGASERLTFARLADIGYVHLRGRGQVVMPDGSTVSLPPAASRTPDRRKKTATGTPSVAKQKGSPAVAPASRP